MDEQASAVEECHSLIESGDWRKALTLAANILSDKTPEFESGRTGMWLRLVMIRCRQSLGEDDLAIADGEGVLTLQPSSDALPDYINVLTELGGVYLRLNKPGHAIQVWNAALTADTQRDRKRRARLTAAIADAFLLFGDHAKAELLCHISMSALTEGDEPLPLLEDRECLLLFADRKIKLARIAEGLRQYRRALYLLEGASIVDRSGVYRREIAFHRGRVNSHLGSLQNAEADFRATMEEGNDPDPTIDMLTEEQIGVLEMRRSNPSGALTHFLRSMELFDAGISQLRAEEFRLSVRENSQSLYERAVGAAMACGESEAALLCSERSRGRAFLDHLINRHSSLSSPHLPGYSAEFTQISKQIGALEQLLIDARLAGEKSRALVTEAQYRRLRENKVAILRKQEVDQSLSAPIARSDIASRRDLADLVAADGTALIEYFVGADQFHVFVLTNKGLRCVTIGFSKRTLESDIARLRSLVQAPSRWRRDVSIVRLREHDRESEAECKSLCSRLFRLLIQPVEECLRKAMRVTIVPHGALSYLPFAMLGEVQCLAEQFEIAYAPTASILHWLRKQSQQAGLEPVLVIANPLLNQAELALPYAEQEGRSIAEMFHSSRFYTGAHATVPLFREEAPLAGLIHMACHAHFDRNEPLLSSLLMAGGDCLEVHEIANMKLSSKLVTLSACETGLAHLSGGDEYLGFIRGFMIAGAPTVIATHWPVEDASTAKAMIGFYRAVHSGTGPASALRQVQLDLRRSPEYRHPYYWAGFACYGDPRN